MVDKSKKSLSVADDIEDKRKVSLQCNGNCDTAAELDFLVNEYDNFHFEWINKIRSMDRKNEIDETTQLCS